MSLSTYNKKRNFKNTPEPEEKAGETKSAKNIFVIKRHHESVRRFFNYDFPDIANVTREVSNGVPATS
jgi:hypothetical protein